MADCGKVKFVALISLCDKSGGSDSITEEYLDNL